MSRQAKRTEPRVALLVIVSGFLASGAARSSGTSDRGLWEVVVQLAEGLQENHKPALWVGLQNQSERPKIICVASLWYNLSEEKRQLGGGTVWPDSPHACRTGAQKHLVLPGQTHFQFAEIPNEAHVTPRAELQLWVHGYEYEQSTPADGRPVTLTWRGTPTGR